MDKRSKIVLYSIGFIILLMMIAELTKPKAVNWRDSYSASDKIPLGCFVLYNELPSLSKLPILESRSSIYDYLKTLDSGQSKTLIFINNYLNFDREETQAILSFVEEGNSVFMSSLYNYGPLADTLKLELDGKEAGLFKSPSFHSFSSPNLKEYHAEYNEVIENSHVISLDTLNSKVLGYSQILEENDSDRQPNYIKTTFGENNGAFYIHSNPFAFSNYHMLSGKDNYASVVLSFLPDQQLIWDHHYKSGRKIISTPLRYILVNQPLKWALYLSMIGLGLYILFRGKRTQRIIPVIEPVKNYTVDFTRTIGQLYYQYGDYSNIIQQKITYFLEYIRTHYYLNTNTLNNTFIDKLSVKSSNSKQDTKQLIDLIIFLKSKKVHTQSELIKLNKLIEEFTNTHQYGRTK